MSLFNTTTGRGIKFATIGDSVTGTVTRTPFEQQMTKFGSQDLDTWPNGDPKMQIIVGLQTGLREDQDDDGERTLYVSSTAMKKAIGEAMAQAGAPDVEAGGTLTVTYVGNDPASKNPQNPKKLYQAQYSKPTGAFAQQAPASVPVQAYAQPAPTQQQVYQPPAQQQPVQVPGATAFPQQQLAPVSFATPAQPYVAGQQPAGALPAQPQATPGGLPDELVNKIKQLSQLGIDEAGINNATGVDIPTIQQIIAF